MTRYAALAAILFAGAAIHPLRAAEPALDGSELRALPPVKKGDIASQIRVVAYSATKRQEITGIVGQPTTFTFPSGENVYRVVQTTKPDVNGELADAGWHGPKPDQLKDTPLGNVLTLWPARPGFTTMSVITKLPDGNQKVYPFRLTALSDGDGAATSNNVTLNLIFKGGSAGSGGGRSAESTAHLLTASSDDPRTAPRKERRARARRRQIDDEAATERIRTDAFNRADGCHYTAKGPLGPIEPRCPLSNGIWTIMRFPGLTQKPAVYISDPAYLCGADDGAHERLARQHGSGDFVVVEDIAQRFCVRLGPAVLQIDNSAYSPAGEPTDTGTIAPTVRREVIKADRR